MSDTITAIATPVGAGGINIIRLSGPASLTIATRLFRPKDALPTASPPTASPPTAGSPTASPPTAGSASALEPQKATFGELRDPVTGQLVDEVLCIFFRAPKSYTCEDVVEIHCHGGALVASKILQLTIDQGARLAQPGEFTRRAFINGRLDLTQAEAVADVIHAASDQALAAALAQLQGKLSEKLNRLYDRLLSVLTQLEAAIDFPEEGLEFDQKQKLEKTIEEVQSEIIKLVESYRQGKIFREGARVTIVGKPNTGKSSLLNALLNEDRAIVTPLPGTTRDVLEERVRIKDIHIQIVDTAGLRHAPDEAIEEHGMARTRSALATADIALVICDGSQPLDDNDDLLIREVGLKPKLVIVNKCDLPPVMDEADLLKKTHETDAIHLSALTGEGLDTLIDAIHQFIMQAGRSGEDLVITRERHRQALTETYAALDRVRASLKDNLSEDLIAVDLNRALEEIGGILGKTFVEDMLDQIFNDFCIGK